MNAKSVSDLLESRGGYSSASLPLRVNDIEFRGDFDAVLVGPNGERGLVLVLDAASVPAKTIQRRVKAVCLALARTGSMRPVTIVVNAGQALDRHAVAELQALCRLIVIPADGNPEEYLRSLLRLKLKRPQGQESRSAGAVLREELGGRIADAFVEALIEAARRGPSDVEATVREQIDRVATIDLESGGKGP
jgi:hypothetical protein